MSSLVFIMEDWSNTSTFGLERRLPLMRFHKLTFTSTFTLKLKINLLRLPLLLTNLLNLMSIWEEALSNTERFRVRKVPGSRLTLRRESDT